MWNWDIKRKKRCGESSRSLAIGNIQCTGMDGEKAGCAVGGVGQWARGTWNEVQRKTRANQSWLF